MMDTLVGPHVKKNGTHVKPYWQEREERKAEARGIPKYYDYGPKSHKCSVCGWSPAYPYEFQNAGGIMMKMYLCERCRKYET